MTYLNPLTGAALAGGHVQEQQAAEKARRAQAVARNVAAEGDRFEHQVESTEGLAAIHDDQSPKQQPHDRKPPRPPEEDPHRDEGGPTHLDVTA